MRWYYKYLPYFILERKLSEEDDFNSPTVKYIDDRVMSVVMLEIEKGVWIGTNKKEYLLKEKAQLEKKIKNINKELEWLEHELSEMD